MGYEGPGAGTPSRGSNRGKERGEAARGTRNPQQDQPGCRRPSEARLAGTSQTVEGLKSHTKGSSQTYSSMPLEPHIKHGKGLRD